MESIDAVTARYELEKRRSAMDAIRRIALDAGLAVNTGYRTETEGHNAGKTMRTVEVHYVEES